MPRQVKTNFKIHTEPLTKTVKIGDVICHSETPRKYFTLENNDIIYTKMKELKITYPPYLGPCVDFGLGDVCLEETGDKFKFYLVERMHKYQCADFDNLKDAVDHLVEFYIKNKYVRDGEAFKKIFYELFKL